MCFSFPGTSVLPVELVKELLGMSPLVGVTLEV